VFYAKFIKKENGDLQRITNDERVPFGQVVENLDKDACVVYSFSGNSNSPIAQILSDFECFEAEELLGRGEAAANFADNCATLQIIDEIFPNYMQLSYAERCQK
jgi:hypothetical protein